jgi:two-component system, NtrC family, nitrogen regulation sensor histidine kinase NtrY
VGKFHQYLCAFSGDLSIKKQRYDQHAYLVYQLIDQINIPVMVFNDKGQLSYANGAFSKLYAGKPWQSYRYASAQLLGLTDTQEGFQFNRDDFAEHAQWQISQSCFIDADRTYRLVVFTNIKAAVHSGKIQAWQQMINVMGHEIRNSLTPVSSIAQSLAGRAADQRDQDALALISQRCLLLQDFVDRYACLSKRLHIQSENIQSREVVARIKHLFAQASITAKYKADELQADKSLLEQVLINLVKNALEANAKNIHLEFNEDHATSFIHVIDDGHGFANIDNAFVPLFTTKEEGQGIGLSFCRNIIEHHKGTLNVRNNEGSGVTMTIQLPKV